MKCEYEAFVPRVEAVITKGFIAAAFIAAVLTFSSIAKADGGAEIVWTAAKVEGTVNYREGGHPDTRWVPLRTGALLSALAELKTGANGRAELRYETSLIVAGPNSEFKLPGPTPKDAVYRVSQKVGTFLYKIKHATRDKFEVRTPFLTTTIKGTIFTVLASPGGSSVHVTEGAVFVQPTGGAGGTFVRPGQTARVGANNPGNVTIQGSNRNGGSSTTPGDDQRTDASEKPKRKGKPVKIVFRDISTQVASLGDTATVVSGNAKEKGSSDELKGQDNAATPGSDNASNGNGNGNSSNNGNNGNGQGNNGNNGNNANNGNNGQGNNGNGNGNAGLRGNGNGLGLGNGNSGNNANAGGNGNGNALGLARANANNGNGSLGNGNSGRNNAGLGGGNANPGGNGNGNGGGLGGGNANPGGNGNGNGGGLGGGNSNPGGNAGNNGNNGNGGGLGGGNSNPGNNGNGGGGGNSNAGNGNSNGNGNGNGNGRNG